MSVDVDEMVRLNRQWQEVFVRVGNGSDRKSTRLNSSHANISYAVFCLKKNKTVLPPTVVSQLAQCAHAICPQLIATRTFTLLRFPAQLSARVIEQAYNERLQVRPIFVV